MNIFEKTIIVGIVLSSVKNFRNMIFNLFAVIRSFRQIFFLVWTRSSIDCIWADGFVGFENFASDW